MDHANPSSETASYTPELVALLQRGMGSDQSCLPELRRALDEHPALVDQFGDLVQHIQIKLIACATDSVLGQEAFRRKAAELRAQLRETATTPIEKLLADRVSLCWIDVLTADLEFANRRKTEPGDTPIVRAAEGRVDSAQARFLKAMKALATAQKHLRPGPSVLELLGGKSNGTRTNGAGERRADFNPETQGTPAAN
jgi:hypothetical protein